MDLLLLFGNKSIFHPKTLTLLLRKLRIFQKCVRAKVTQFREFFATLTLITLFLGLFTN